jgi:crotonobetainyl-CoA:carnitine CoA-transferase CaiB-like acyl-CoA transferase
MAPLDGIRVLDLTRVLAGPFCTMNLGDMGAEVLKIEDPDGGDDTRAFGPPFVNGVSTYFLSINRNKKSLAVNLKHPQGLALVLRLADRADVVVENFRPGVAERLGLGFDAIRGRNPRVVYCSISGFGHDGLPEYSKLAGYDVVVQGLSGLQHLTGDPSGPPTKAGISIADLLTGMTAFQAILLALFERERTGSGQRLDISMLDSTVQVLTFQATSHLLAGNSPQRMGNRHPSICPYETFRCRDGYFNLAVGNDSQFRALCALIGKAALADDGRFARNPDRVRNHDALVAELAPRFAERTSADWVSALQAAGVPAGVINDVDHALAHPQLAARGMLATTHHPIAGELRLLGSPLKLDSAKGAGTMRPPPGLGEHTAEVLGGLLGVDARALEALAAAGAIALA